MSPADALRNTIAALETVLAQQRAALAVLESDADAGAPDDAHVTIREICGALDLKYDAARARVSRAGVGRKIAGTVYVPRAWLTEQLLDVRSVRSVSEQGSHDA
jgi:hypothetical protein